MNLLHVLNDFSSDEENDDVVCNLNFGDCYCTGERAPYNELNFEVSAPHERGEEPRELGPNPFFAAVADS